MIWPPETKETARHLYQVGLTRRDIAEKLDIPRSTLNKWLPSELRQCYSCSHVMYRYPRKDNSFAINSLCRSCDADAERLKQIVFNHFGWNKCLCCGEEYIPYLTIAHLDDDGYLHKKPGWKVRLKGMVLCRELIKTGFACEFRLGPLCCNCQVGCEDNPDPHHTVKVMKDD